jgi:transposase
MMSVTELLSHAKRAIEAGETSLRAAAEDIAAAQEQGATQREIAEAVGKSAAWVNRLLKWREGGYQDVTPFGPQAKASRQRARRVQSPEQKNQKPASTSEQARAAERRRQIEDHLR